MIDQQLRTQIGRNLAGFRRSQNPSLKLEDVAGTLNCSKTRVKQIEAGKASLRAEDVITLHAVYALDLCTLFAMCVDSLPDDESTSDGP